MTKPLLAAAMALAACATLPASDEAATSLAAAETAFAAHSVREDMRAAFVAAFAPDGLLVRSGWANARESWSARAAPPIVLDWKPVHVEAARSGDLGLSTGPWRITPRGGKAPTDYGQFVSIWEREPGGAWQVAVDIGISHPAPTLWDAPLDARTSPGTPGRAPLEAAEAAFADLAASSGPRFAWAAWAAEDLRLYRDGHEPWLGRGDVARHQWDEARVAFVPERIVTARSGELGYARGHLAMPRTPGVKGWYLHVWRHEAAGWRLVADVVNPAKG